MLIYAAQPILSRLLWSFVRKSTETAVYFPVLRSDCRFIAVDALPRPAQLAVPLTEKGIDD
jgi:hypothetical protein